MTEAREPTGPPPETVPIWAGWLAGGLLAIHLVAGWLIRVPLVSTGNDEAVYLLLGRALRHLSYRELFTVGQPIHSQYPPLYPAFLAGLSGAVGERLDLLLAANLLLSAAALAVTYLVARRWSPTAALIALAIAATNPELLKVAGGLRSEPLFMLLTAIGLASITGTGRDRPRIAIAALIAAALTRSIGITLLIGLGGYFLVARRWRLAGATAIGAAIFVGPWLGWTMLAPNQLAGRSYIADLAYRAPEALPNARALPPAPTPPVDPTAAPRLSDSTRPAPPDSALDRRPEPGSPGLIQTLLARPVRNVPIFLIRRLPKVLALPVVPGTTVDNWAWLGVLVAVLVTGLVTLISRWPTAGFGLLAYGALLVVWPYPLARFLVPMIPYLVLAILLGAESLARWAGRRLGRWRLDRWAVVGLGAVIMLGGSAATWEVMAARQACDRDAPYRSSGCISEVEQRFFEATDAIVRTTPPTARILAAKEGPVYFYTGRQVVPLGPMVSGPIPDLRQYLAANQAEYVLLSHLKIDEAALPMSLRPICREFRLIGNWGPATLLLQGPTTTGGLSEEACVAIDRYAQVSWEDRAPLRTTIR